MEIKPCPFCGEEARINKYSETGGHGECDTIVVVKCTLCGAEMPGNLDEYYEPDIIKKAIMAWNKRV